MLSTQLRQQIEPHTGPIQRTTQVGGGDIAAASRLDAAGGRFFLKQATGNAGESLVAEGAGLEALAAAARGTGLRVPEVLHVRAPDGAPGLLLLPWIEQGHADERSFRRLGEGLAAQHRKAPAEPRGFGFRDDNFIGATAQANGWMDDWVAFFRQRRLEPQIELAQRRGRWSAAWDPPAQRLLGRLGDWLPGAPAASLVHGDLWSGNHLPGADGTPWLIDPAVYVGHREVDLAMTELFGGFGPAFYAAYESAWKLEPGYPDRREIYNLYHRLNHLNLFGAGYAGGVERTLRRYG